MSFKKTLKSLIFEEDNSNSNTDNSNIVKNNTTIEKAEIHKTAFEFENIHTKGIVSNNDIFSNGEDDFIAQNRVQETSRFDSKIQQEVIKFREYYDNLFNQLNKSGIDFFEFHKMYSQQDTKKIEDVFLMCKILNPDLTKDILLSEAENYLQLIKQDYENNKAKANERYLEAKNQDKLLLENTNNEIKNIELEINRLNDLLKSKQLLLKQNSNVSDSILSKKEANDIAYENLKNLIIKTKEEINQKLK